MAAVKLFLQLHVLRACQICTQHFYSLFQQVTHHMQYPPGTEVVYSYFESRGGKFQEITFFGLQYIIKVT